MQDSDSEQSNNMGHINVQIDPKKDRFPFCIVWTPLPLLTWLFPLIGHMGIALSSGVIRDFSGHYYVSEDNMAFGKPTKYWQLNVDLADGGIQGWDRGVTEASEIYKKRMHNICCDNCHSHVATALNIMGYKNKKSWNMVNLAFMILFHGRYVNFWGWLKTWGPFLIIASLATIFYLCFFY